MRVYVPAEFPFANRLMSEYLAIKSTLKDHQVMDMKVRKALETLELKLHSAPKIQIFLSDSWASAVTLEAGVYAVWTFKPHVPVYVGQTTSLRHRMRDLGRQINHTFPRGIAKKMTFRGCKEGACQSVFRRVVVQSRQHFVGGRDPCVDRVALVSKDDDADLFFGNEGHVGPEAVCRPSLVNQDGILQAQRGIELGRWIGFQQEFGRVPRQQIGQPTGYGYCSQIRSCVIAPIR